MVFKLICDDEKITTENFNEEVHVYQRLNKWILVNGSEKEVDLKLRIDGCVVKYTPEKYDKITLVMPKEATEFLYKMQEKIMSEVDAEFFIKGNIMGLKLSKEQKTMCVNELKKGDYINVIVNFNYVWLINKKKYASFELVQFKKIEKPETEKIDYFADD